MKLKKTLLTFIIAFVCLVCVPTVVSADVGDTNGYGGGSSGDAGSAGGYSGGYAGGIYDGGDAGDGYQGRYSGRSGNSLTRNEWTISLVSLTIFIGLIITINKRNSLPKQGDHTEMILPAITADDPLFNEAQFVAYAKEVFVLLQQAWMDRDWERVRILEREGLFSRHDAQVRRYINQEEINVIDCINIRKVFLHKYERDEQYERLAVYMDVRMIDYIKHEKTDVVIKGNPHVSCHLKYLLTFRRERGLKTARKGDFKKAGPDWVLSDLVGINASTRVDNRGVIIRDGEAQDHTGSEEGRPE